MSLSTTLAVVLLGCVHFANADGVSFYGCYSNGGNLTEKKVSTSTFQSSGYCRDNCTSLEVSDGVVGYNVQGMTKGYDCYCSLTLPWEGYKVDNSSCSDGCGGYPSDSCGSRLGDYWSVYLTGLESADAISEDPKPTSSSTASASKTTLINTTDPSKPSTVVVTQSAVPDTSTTPSTVAKDSGGGVNKAAIAAGCVVGVLAIIAISVGAFIFLRKRRRQKIEEEYRRSAAVREYTKKPEADPRLDPSMIQRRDSVGSIADTQDYSRRILKVTNPDG